MDIYLFLVAAIWPSPDARQNPVSCESKYQISSTGDCQTVQSSLEIYYCHLTGHTSHISHLTSLGLSNYGFLGNIISTRLLKLGLTPYFLEGELK